MTGDELGPPHRRHVAKVEVDHEFPLFRIPSTHPGEAWFELLRFWGFGNLRALSPAGHALKTAQEARWRADNRPAPNQGALL